MRRRLLLVGALFLFTLSACPKRGPVESGSTGIETAGTSSIRGSDVTAGLPADSLAYSRLEVSELLKLLERTVLFVDKDLGQEMVLQAKKLHQGLQRMVRNRGFQAGLLDHWQDTRLHLVVLRQEEADQAEGELKAKSLSKGEVLMRKARPRGLWGEDACVSIIIETEPGLAKDFVDQIRALLVKEVEAGESGKGFVFRELEVEKGRMLQLERSGLCLGQFEGLLVFSDKQPKSLWKSLVAGPARSLADDETHARVSQGGPAWYFMLELGGMAVDKERSLTRQIQKLDAKPDQPNPGIWKIERSMAEENLKSFQMFKQLLGLDKFHKLSGRMLVDFGESAARFALQGQVDHDQALPPATRALLDGGRLFQLPAGKYDHAFGLMLRFGLMEIYTEVIERLDPAELSQYQAGAAMVKSQTGYAVEDLLRLLSGDFYLMLDLEMLELNTGTEIKVPQVPNPVFGVLLGVGDRDKTLEAVGTIAERTAAMTAGFVSRREFLGDEVFLFGPQADNPDADPQANIMSACVLDQHIAFGEWAMVTDFIRKRKASGQASGVLAQAVASNPKASMLMVASQKLSEQIRGMSKKDGTTERLVEELKSLEMPDEDPQTVAMVTEALARLVELSEELQKRSSQMQAPVGILSGHAREGRYELLIVNELMRGQAGP